MPRIISDNLSENITPPMAFSHFSRTLMLADRFEFNDSTLNYSSASPKLPRILNSDRGNKFSSCLNLILKFQFFFQLNIWIIERFNTLLICYVCVHRENFKVSNCDVQILSSNNIDINSLFHNVEFAVQISSFWLEKKKKRERKWNLNSDWKINTLVCEICTFIFRLRGSII